MSFICIGSLGVEVLVVGEHLQREVRLVSISAKLDHARQTRVLEIQLVARKVVLSDGDSVLSAKGLERVGALQSNAPAEKALLLVLQVKGAHRAIAHFDLDFLKIFVQLVGGAVKVEAEERDEGRHAFS